METSTREPRREDAGLHRHATAARRPRTTGLSTISTRLVKKPVAERVSCNRVPGVERRTCSVPSGAGGDIGGSKAGVAAHAERGCAQDGHTGDVTVPRRISRPFRVRFDEATSSGVLRMSAYLRYMQDVAWVHSALAGFDLDWYRAQGVFWLVRCLELRVERGTRPGAELDVSTEVTSVRRIWARRASEFRDGAHDLTAHAVADWVMTTAAGTPTRVPDALRAVFDPHAASFEPAHVRLEATPVDAAMSTIAVRPRDIDPMGHVNNAAYVDYVEEHLAAVGRRELLGTLPRVLRLEYLAPAAEDDAIAAYSWPVAGGRACRLVAGDGRELFRAILQSAPSA